MKITNKIKSVFMLMIVTLAFTSCVKKDYDDISTANVDPAITPNITIRGLQAYATGSTGVEITDDLIISGVIVADDSSGNIYKQMIVQQDSNGISISVDMTDFYSEYKVGRRVFVKCKGLYIANDGGNFSLGTQSTTDPTGRIPRDLVPHYVFKGMWGQYIAPRVYHLGDVIPTNTLVQFNNVEFVDQNVVWATTNSFNLDVTECGSNPATLVVYSSPYSTFHLQAIPNGNGSLVGIYSLYNNSGEIQIRDPRDANMNGLRCNAYITSLQNMSLDSIRMHDPGLATYTLDTARKITVTVTSDYTTGMVTSKNAYVQDATAGIQLRFTGTHSFAKGTVLMIDISNAELSNFHGQLQINNIPLNKAIPVGSATVTPRSATLSDVAANYSAWEGQLIKLNNVTINGPGTYQGNGGVNWIVDSSPDSLELFTSSFATFVNDPYPTGNVSVTGILTEYDGTKEILIRNINDVQ